MQIFHWHDDNSPYHQKTVDQIVISLYFVIAFATIAASAYYLWQGQQ